MEVERCGGESGGVVLIKANVLLTITSLLTIILLTLHLTGETATRDGQFYLTNG